VDIKDEMQWNEIIYQDRMFWEPGSDRRSYTSDTKHFTHIHIDWMTNSMKGKGKSTDEIVKDSPQGNMGKDFSASLIAKLTDINTKLTNGSLSNIDLASIL
jgi:hypothetical protein